MIKFGVKKIVAYWFCVCCLAALITVGAFTAVSARADGNDVGAYTDAYRNRLAYSARAGWNNDPNGLLYANGVYHMYYQYNWEGEKTDLGWGNMSWGHATSADLVHWTERPVAIPAYQTDKDGNYYGMMFSGSAVYDEYNTSGFFDVDEDTGKVVDGQGIVAVITQPRWNDARKTDMQRQILAYSKDGGDSFTIYGEVIAGIDNGNGGYEEFRDPKIFWSETHCKWLMAVGGGSVRMYSSDNMREWDYLGETGYWGECPDISRFTVDGQDKYVLIMSPEDKPQSHEYNGTTRKDSFYPAEYYVVGELDPDGLFVSDDVPRRLSEGLDSYAFQSFNNTLDGKVYGVSWSACWKNVGEYAAFGRDYNGGMTIVTELELKETDDGFALSRKPVAAIDNLRAYNIRTFDGTLKSGDDALYGVNADVADIVLEFDLTESTATAVNVDLRVSDFERISIVYDIENETLSLDRGKSSLLAAQTTRYADVFSKKVKTRDGKLSLRILLDRAFLSMFANDGEASFFSAVFPSAYSTGMSVTSDGDVALKAEVYAMDDIFGGITSRDELIVTTAKIDGVVGNVYTVAAYSFGETFDASAVTFDVVSGAENIALSHSGGVAKIVGKKAGKSVLEVSYGGTTRRVDIYIYADGFDSNIEFTHRFGGDSMFVADDGLIFSTGKSDAFVFSDVSATNFIYSATVTRRNDAQAAGMVIGANDTYYHYYVLTVDFKDCKIKLWEAGVGDLAVVDRDLADMRSLAVKVIALNGELAVYIDGETTVALEYDLDDFTGGFVGLNVYNAEMAFDDVRLTDINAGAYSFDFGGLEVCEVTDGDDGRRLSIEDYTLDGGKITLTEKYIKTLTAGAETELDVTTDHGVFSVAVKSAAEALTLSVANSVYYERAEIALTMSRAETVTKILVDGKPVDFTQDGSSIKLDSKLFDKLSYGLHGIKAYTAGGRAAASFTYGKTPDTSEEIEPEEPTDYTFLIIDLCIFGAIIVVYFVTSTIIKRKNRK